MEEAAAAVGVEAVVEAAAEVDLRHTLQADHHTRQAEVLIQHQMVFTLTRLLQIPEPKLTLTILPGLTASLEGPMCSYTFTIDQIIAIIKQVTSQTLMIKFTTIVMVITSTMTLMDTTSFQSIQKKKLEAAVV